MKNIHSLFVLTITAAISGVPVGTTEAALTAYTADANTLHLWHLDEANPGPANPASGVTGSFNLNADGGKAAIPTPATLGNAAFTGFGTSGETTAGVGAGFRSTNPVAVSSVTGASGAFTFEAMIKTSSIASGNQMIVSMEGNGVASTRPFQFRINGTGQLQFNNIAGAASPGTVAIPTTGTDAFVANEWYHVAVTYTGAEGDANNFKYYWTKVDPTRTAANEIASFQMTADLAGSDSILGAGNDYRTAGTGNTSNMKGMIDEVRISNIARGADQFIFSIPEPSSALLLGLSALAILRRRRS